MGNAIITERPTDEQVMALQVGKIICSIPSVFGATYIVQHVLLSRKQRSRVGKRIILGMSLMDLIYAIVSSFSTVITPKDSGYNLNFSKGDWASCEAFGFLGHGSSVSSAVYNGMLTLHYLLTIRYGWSERRTQRIERWLHFVPLFIGWGTAIPGIPLTLYNPSPVDCSIQGYPGLCDSRGGCIRGEHARLYKMFFLFIWVWATFVFLVIAMGLIYRSIARASGHGEQGQPEHIASQTTKSSTAVLQPESTPSAETNASAVLWSESTMDYFPAEAEVTTPNHPEPRGPVRSSTFLGEPTKSITAISTSATAAGERNNLQRLQQEFAVQATLYCAAFCLTWLFYTLGWILFSWCGLELFLPIVFLNTFFSPMQGFWNFFIYVRPRYLRYRRQQRRREKQEEEQNPAHQEQESAEQQLEDEPAQQQEMEVPHVEPLEETDDPTAQQMRQRPTKENDLVT